MTEKWRKIMYIAGNVIIIPLTPIMALLFIVGIVFNPTDAASNHGVPLAIGSVYALFVVCFYKFMRKPYDGSRLHGIMIYLLTVFISLIVVLGAVIFIYNSLADR